MSERIGKSPALQSKIIQPIISMAREVESMIDLAIGALLSFNVEMASAILEREPAINTAEMKIDAAVFAVLEKGDLSLQEIRQAVSMLKINKDLERMADLAANIGRKINGLAERGQSQDYSELQPMAIAVSHISRKTPARADSQRSGAGCECSGRRINGRFLSRLCFPQTAGTANPR